MYCSPTAARHCADDLIRAVLGGDSHILDWDGSTSSGSGRPDHADDYSNGTDDDEWAGWIEWSPALLGLIWGETEIEIRGVSSALQLRLKPDCANLLQSWLTKLPHPPADQRVSNATTQQ